ncbi:MAG: WbuC family cupin fold metalloprotein [Verrucomicrobiota bacterium]
MKTALTPPKGPVFFLSEELVQVGIIASKKSPRKRMMVPIQRSESAPVQRLLNIMQPGSYVQPHRHPRPQATELVLVIQGAIQIWIFDDSGNITESQRLESGQINTLVDIEPNVWHTFAAQESDTVVLEIKGGPYDRENDKIFAPWAPVETDPAAQIYLESLQRNTSRSIE